MQGNRRRDRVTSVATVCIEQVVQIWIQFMYHHTDPRPAIVADETEIVPDHMHRALHQTLVIDACSPVACNYGYGSLGLASLSCADITVPRCGVKTGRCGAGLSAVLPNSRTASAAAKNSSIRGTVSCGRQLGVRCATTLASPGASIHAVRRLVLHHNTILG